MLEIVMWNATALKNDCKSFLIMALRLFPGGEDNSAMPVPVRGAKNEYDACMFPLNQSSRRFIANRCSSSAWLPILVAVLMVFASTASTYGQAAVHRPDLINAKTEKAIEQGLAHLAKTQAKDGSWRTGSAYGSYPCAMTSLAGLALMAGGNTPVEGKYAPNVRKAVDYVLSCAQPTGLICRPTEEQRPMYGHGFAMLFLGQAYGMERSPARQARIKRVLERAVKLTGASQSTYGGWLYTPESGGDEGSVTVTQIQGLRSIRNAGIKVPKAVIDKACKYVEKSANPDGGIRYTARSGGSSRPPITAAAVAVMYNAGQYENPVAEKSLAYIKKLGKDNGWSRVYGGHKYYAMLYTSQAMYLSSEENWKWFFPSVRDELLNEQSSAGGWQGDSVGTTYGTSIALLILQLPYGYLPILQR